MKVKFLASALTCLFWVIAGILRSLLHILVDLCNFLKKKLSGLYRFFMFICFSDNNVARQAIKNEVSFIYFGAQRVQKNHSIG